jgi:hypothetical protein
MLLQALPTRCAPPLPPSELATQGVSAGSAITSFDFQAAGWAVDEELAQVCATQPSPFSEIQGAEPPPPPPPQQQQQQQQHAYRQYPVAPLQIQTEAASAATATAAAAVAGPTALSPFYQQQAVELQRMHQQWGDGCGSGAAAAAAYAQQQALLPWYRFTVASLEALLVRADAPQPEAAAAAGRELSAVVDELMARVSGLTVNNRWAGARLALRATQCGAHASTCSSAGSRVRSLRGTLDCSPPGRLNAAAHPLTTPPSRSAAAALLCTNLETEGIAAPSESHWRAVVAHMGLTPAQRAAALDCFAVYKERAAAAAASKEEAMRVGCHALWEAASLLGRGSGA